MAWLIGALDPARTWLWRDTLAELLTSRQAILPRSDQPLLGWWQARRGEDAAQALEAARAWMSAAPASADAKWWAASVAVEMGQAEAAAELFEQLRPGFDRLSGGIVPSALMDAGAWAFHEVGDYPAELAWIDRFAADRFAGPFGCRRAVAVRALMESEIDFDAAASECSSESSTPAALRSASLRLGAATELRAHGALVQARRIANEAIIQYESAIRTELPPHQASWYWQRLGDLKLLTGDWSGAREAFRHAIALQEQVPWAWGGLGVALARSGEVAETETVLDRLRTRSDQLSAYEQARIHASLGRADSAAAILGLLPSGGPSRVKSRLRHDVAFDGMRSGGGTGH
jgi:tetratricopeptide (TPR) repeat protein